MATIVRELKAAVLDSRVNNIYQLDSKTLLLKLHKTDTQPYDLILEAGKRLHLTSYAVEKPPVPPAFCMALRKYMRNSRLTSLEQYEFERVIVFGLETNSGHLRLVLELFGDGNIILVNENGEILHALTYRRMRDRNIVRHEVFRFPPASGKNPMRITRLEFLEELKTSGNTEIVRVLARHLSIGGIYAEETLLRAEIDKNKQCTTLSQPENDAIFNALQSLLARASQGDIEPLIVLNSDGDFVDAVPFRLQRYGGMGFKVQPRTSFNEALDEFYVRVASVEKALTDLKIDELKEEAERLKRIIEDQQNVLAEAEVSSIENKRIGNTVYAHSVELQALLDRLVSSKQSGKRWDMIVSELLAEKKAGVSPSILFESFPGGGLIANVCVAGTHFSLNLHKSLFENAATFYEKSKRAKQKLEGAKTALKETQERLASIEARMSKAEALEHVKPTAVMEELERRRVKQKEWFEKYRWFRSSDDFLVVAGKDAVSNEALIKKHCTPEDIVFHAEIVGASFVVVKTDGKQPSDQVLEEAAEFAAAHSKGWKERFASVDVFWVKPEQLGKGGPSGQYVTRGAFAVTGKRSWKRNVPLRMAVGALIGEDGLTRFVGGPPNSVRAKTQIYVTIMPGNFVGKRLFAHILKTLSENMPKDQRQHLLKASIEEIREFIPYGVGEVLKG